MFLFIIKLSKRLKPFKKITYLLALLIAAHVIYSLIFAADPSQAQDKSLMLSFLSLIWLALINLMLNIFTTIPEKGVGKRTWFSRVKYRLQQGLYYFLSVVFIALTLALLLLSLRMLRI